MHRQSTFYTSNRNAVSRYSVSNQQRFLCIPNTSRFDHVRDSKISTQAPRQRQTLSFRNNQNDVFFLDIRHSPDIHKFNVSCVEDDLLLSDVSSRFLGIERYLLLH